MSSAVSSPCKIDFLYLEFIFLEYVLPPGSLAVVRFVNHILHWPPFLGSLIEYLVSLNISMVMVPILHYMQILKIVNKFVQLYFVEIDNFHYNLYLFSC